MAKQTKITKSAKGEECQIRIPSVCCWNDESTVFCHLSGGGMGRKSSDLHGAYGCSSCHDEVDGRTMKSDRDYVKRCFYEAIIRTQLILMEKGLIKL